MAALKSLHMAALRLFRQMPAPMRRFLVRTGTPNYTVGAVVVLDHDGDVLFLRQPHRPGWSLPGGLLKPHEQPDIGVVREAREETGLTISVDLPFTCLVNSHVRRVDIIYLVQVSERPQVKPGGEALDYRWMPVSEVDIADDSTIEILQALASARRAGGLS